MKQKNNTPAENKDDNVLQTRKSMELSWNHSEISVRQIRCKKITKTVSTLSDLEHVGHTTENSGQEHSQKFRTRMTDSPVEQSGMGRTMRSMSISSAGKLRHRHGGGSPRSSHSFSRQGSMSSRDGGSRFRQRERQGELDQKFTDYIAHNRSASADWRFRVFDKRKPPPTAGSVPANVEVNMLENTNVKHSIAKHITPVHHMPPVPNL